MRPLFWAALGVVALALGACGGGGGGGSCCGFTTIKRGAAYVGTIPSTDGGTPTQVEVTVSSSGATSFTFTNGGRTIVHAATSEPYYGP